MGNKGDLFLTQTRLTTKDFENEKKFYFDDPNSAMWFGNGSSSDFVDNIPTQFFITHSYNNTGEVLVLGKHLDLYLGSPEPDQPVIRFQKATRSLWGILKTTGDIDYYANERIGILDDFKDFVVGKTLKIHNGHWELDKDYIFTTINQLAFDTHSFYTEHLLQALSLAIKTKEKTTLGKDNDHMGKLKTTKGTLEIEASEIDARYGKALAYGPLIATATQKSILVGDKKVRTVTAPKDLKFSTHARPPKEITKYIPNGAVFASKESVTLSAKEPIHLSFCDVISNGDTIFKTPLVKSISARIQSSHDIKMPDLYYATRSEPQNLRSPSHIEAGYFRPTQYFLETTGPALLQAQNTLHFDPQTKVELEYSDLFSGKPIACDPKLFKIKSRCEEAVTQYHPHLCHKFNVIPARVFSGDGIAIGGEEVDLNGVIHAPIVVIDSKKTKNTALPIASPTQTPINQKINVTEFILNWIKNSGFYKMDKDGVAIPEFPLNVGKAPTMGEMLELPPKPGISQTALTHP